MPSSSFVVVITSSGPCTIFLSSSTASAIDRPMPLSAPSDVPRAFIQPFSSYASMGVWSGSSIPTHTISMWFSITMGVAPSQPGVAGFLITTQFCSSRSYSSPSRLAKSHRKSATFSSWCDGRGTAFNCLKISKTRFVVHISLFAFNLLHSCFASSHLPPT